MRASLGDQAPIGKPVCEAIPSRIRHARHRSPQTQRPTVGGHPSKGNPTLAVRGQLDDRTGSTVSRLSCVLHESTRTSSFLVQDFVRIPSLGHFVPALTPPQGRGDLTAINPSFHLMILPVRPSPA